MFDPAPNLPDDTLIETVSFSPLIRKSLNAAGLKTIGEIRAMPDDKLRRMRGIGTGSFANLRTGLKAKMRPARQTDANREFQRPPHTNLKWFLIVLIAFAIIDYLSLASPGLR